MNSTQFSASLSAVEELAARSAALARTLRDTVTNQENELAESRRRVAELAKKVLENEEAMKKLEKEQKENAEKIRALAQKAKAARKTNVLLGQLSTVAGAVMIGGPIGIAAIFLGAPAVDVYFRE
ncbi:MAG: hypothetical protein H0W88_00185 [Parachlamydiaceae bacterium]|nr:hypothetical protein [Parachlamydiaceae bacterium]